MFRVICCLAVLASALGQAPASSEARVASVQVKGHKRYTPEEVSRLSGIQIGRPASRADLDAAANRLAATGFFDSVGYTYTSANGAMTVTFDIVEASWTVPVILDNFVWLSDEQWSAALREDVPSYDGTLPLNAGSSDSLTRALEKLVKARGIPGRVQFNPQVDLKGGPPKFLFAMKDPSPKVCALRVSGSAAIPERDLIDTLQGTIGGDYSRAFLSAAASGTLTDLYRRKGFWRAAFAIPSTALDACQGVAVTLAVSEGPHYQWDHAEWSGHRALTTETLNKAVGMKAGETADAGKIDLGLRAVREAYGRQGYLAQRSHFQPKLDDASRRAVFDVVIEEGRQFHMGTLTFEGIRDSDATNLAKQWRLKPGDVYDESHEATYLRDVIYRLQTSAGGRGHLARSLDPDRGVVDVKIVFK